MLARLRKETQSRVTDSSLRGLALAAIRETFEETGLILGEASDTSPTSRNSEWNAYFGHGVVPPLAHMDFIARAVTPTYRTRRFDTRFFMMYDTHIHTDPEDTRGASGELLDLHWLTIAQARKLDLPAITRQVLDIVEERMQLPFEKRFAAPRLSSNLNAASRSFPSFRPIWVDILAKTPIFAAKWQDHSVFGTSTMAKPTTVKIKLESTAGTGFYYVAKKNARTMTEKMVVKKYDPVVRKHVEFKENKIK